MNLSEAQVITVNMLGDPASLHPHTGVDLMCRSVQKALFEGLMRINPSEKPEFAVAESLNISDDHTIYTFKLKPTLWSNGEPLTAFHFESAWKRGIAFGSNCLRADLFYPIKNALKAKSGLVPLTEVGVKALDKEILEIELEHPTPYFLELLSLPLYSPLYNEAEDPTVFNGPFRVEEWEHQVFLKLTKNEHYWNHDAVKLKELFFSLVPDANTALLMYEKDEIDFAGSPFTDLPTDVLSKLENLSSKPVTGVFWLCCNTNSFPLNSKNIRKALAYSLNRVELAEIIGGDTPSCTVVPQDILPLGQDDLYCDHNIKLAITAFEEGLEELHLKREDFPTLVLSHSLLCGHKSLAEACARMWEKNLGIKVEFLGSTWNTFFHNLGTRQFQIGGCFWYSAFNDPICTLEFFKDPKHRYNSPGWENETYRTLLDLADNEKDLKIREEHLRQAEKILLDEMPVIPILNTRLKYLMKESVKDLYISKGGLIDFKWAYIQKRREAI